ECIISALSQTYGNVEVIFADNGSTDDSCEYVRARYGDRVRVVCLGRNYGFALGNNIASKFASKDSEYLLFLNPDAVLEPDYVETIIKLMERNKWIGAAQGVQVSMDGLFVSLGGYVDSYGRGVEFILRNFTPKRPIKVLWVSGSAMAIRRKLFVKLGGFSPELFLYHDEIDLCSRVWLSGYAVALVPLTKYRHLRGGAVGSANWLGWYFANRNRWLTTIRYMPLANMIASLLIALPLEFLVNIIKSIRRQERWRAPLYVKILRFIARKFVSNARKRPGAMALKNLKSLMINVKSPLSKEREALSFIPQRLRNLVLM
ncbi:MAG: glycosyltransferase family 2 protein, partial [Thermoproteaceae archaeon]|nr:glycosyltransferase family 2 protein [Thermoproteaceae archaeon]